MTVAIKYAQIQSPIEQRRDRANWTRQGPSLVEIGWKNQGAYRCGVAPNRCDCAGSPSTPPKKSVAEKNPQPRLEHWTLVVAGDKPVAVSVLHAIVAIHTVKQ